MRTYANTVTNKFATDTTGNAGAGALITVYVAASAVKAPLFDVLSASITNPLAADDEGNYSFKVADGIYDLVINEGALSETRIDRLQIAEIVGFNGDNGHYPTIIAALAADLDVGAIVTTAGYSVTNDGAGAEYIVVPGGTGPIVAGLYINMLNGNQLSVIVNTLNFPVEDIASLRLTEPRVDNQQIELLGHTVSGIGGGAFYFDAQDVTTSDNSGTVIVTTNGARWKRPSIGYVTPEMFGALGDGSDETTKLQAWIDSSTSLQAGTNLGESKAEYTYTHLVMSKENHNLNNIGDVRYICTSSGAQASFILSGDFASIDGGFFLGTSLGSKLETTGFSNRLSNVLVSGSHVNGLRIGGLETKVVLGKYRGGTNAAISVNQADAFLMGPYCEQAENGLKAEGIGSINAYHVHAFGNVKRGFFLSGAAFSQLTSCYADTNGSNGFELRDMSSGLTMTDCWSFKSGQLTASSAQMQFFNCQNTKLIGCRMSTPGAAGTSESIRFSGSTNQIDLISCYSDQGTTSFQRPNTMTTCTGSLQKFSRAWSTYITGGITLNAAASGDTTVNLNSSTDSISPGFKSYDIRLTYRTSSGANAVGIEDQTVLILNGITGVGNVITRFPSSPVLTLSNPILVDTGNGQADLTITVTNTDATRDIQYSMEVIERSSNRGYI